MVPTEVFNYINQVQSATARGAVPWGRVNPTTISWKPSPEINIVIQKIEESTLSIEGGKATAGKTVNYVFHVSDKNEVAGLSVKSSENPELKQMLEQLYREAEISATKNAVALLSKLLPS